jgi:hypothetical protein
MQPEAAFDGKIIAETAVLHGPVAERIWAGDDRRRQGLRGC